MAELTTQNAAEVLGVGDPEIRVTQNAIETLGSATPDLRTTQNAVEVLGVTNPDARVTQNAVEVIGVANPNALITQIAVEVLIPVFVPPPPLPPFGYRGNIHQRHDTGQTNDPISHQQPLNQWTTTKSIGIRRKWIMGGAIAAVPLNLIPTPGVPSCHKLQTMQVDTSTSFNIPNYGVGYLYVECFGAGGDGANAPGGDTVAPGTGGGSGAYAASYVAVSPGETINVNIDVPGGGGFTSVSGNIFAVAAESAAGSTGGDAVDSTGDIRIDGQDGNPGTPDNEGGNGADGFLGAGGAGGWGFPTVPFGSPGAPGGLTAGGGGGGYGSNTGGAGAQGGAGYVRISTYANFNIFGHRNEYHQTRSTGQTNIAITHGCGLNNWTTTKGIGMRRQRVAAAALSSIAVPSTANALITYINLKVTTSCESATRVTQQYAEVFNVDPPTPNIRTTQYYTEILDAPGNPFGLDGNTHQRHDTGPTNDPIPHDFPLNHWTSTKGIGLRRIPYIAVAAAAPQFPPLLELSCSRTVRIANLATFVGTTPPTTWVPPAGTNSLLIECFGAGEIGAGAGEGGDGGDYAASILNVSYGQEITVSIGNNAEVLNQDTLEVVRARSGGEVDNNSGQLIINGTAGQPGITEFPYGGGTGGSSAGGGVGGAGGVDEDNPDGQPGTNFGGGGGGAWNDGEIGGEGGAAGEGLVRISWCVPFGYQGDTHRFHNTGPTNDPIPHNIPINQYTTGRGIGMRRKWVLAGAIAGTISIFPTLSICNRVADFGNAEFQGAGTITTDWVVPAGIYLIKVECWGGGGHGVQPFVIDGNEYQGGGGGGGAGYGSSIIAVTPGDTYTITIGDSGQNSEFGPALVRGGGTTSTSGGGDCLGQITYGGADGDPGTGTVPVYGPGAKGGNAGGIAFGGGAGGAGGTAGTLSSDGGPGDPGGFPGGGGGGGGASGTFPGEGGVGAPGNVRISVLNTFGFGAGIGGFERTHQLHNTGQTNTAIQHCLPLNRWTTTKGIGMRRKYIVGAGLTPAALPPGLSLPCGPTVPIVID